MALGKAAIFAAVAKESNEGAEFLIGAAVGNQPVVRIGDGELRKGTVVHLQELLGIMHLGKKMRTTADRIVLRVTDTAVDEVLYALGTQPTTEEQQSMPPSQRGRSI